MPKPNYTTDAPPEVKRACERHRIDTRLTTAEGGALTVAAVGTHNWLRAAYARGYDIRPDEVPTPAHDRLAAFTGDAVETAALRVLLSLELDSERRCKTLAESMRKWASEPSENELADQRRVELRRQLNDIALEQRAQNLIAAAETDRREKALIAARKQAAKEMEKPQ